MRLLGGPAAPRKVLSTTLEKECPKCGNFFSVGEFVGLIKIEKATEGAVDHVCVSKGQEPPEHFNARCESVDLGGADFTAVFVDELTNLDFEKN